MSVTMTSYVNTVFQIIQLRKKSTQQNAAFITRENSDMDMNNEKRLG